VTTLAERFREHADACDRMGAPLYGVLMRGMADDWESSGIVREICTGWEHASAADVVQLRLLGGLHRLVLTGEADELRPYYRSSGGARPPADAWPVARAVIAAHVDRLRDALTIVPQTNEVGRSAALVVALYAAAAATGLHKVRLLEVGASAGLNLRVDHLRVVTRSWTWGPTDSPVVLNDAVDGDIAATDVQIVDRRGCDLHPIDPLTEAGSLRLRSFVWPDHVERARRLDGALKIAARVPAVVDRSEATPWLRERLAERCGDDVLTLVWHSVVWQYLQPAERAAAEAVIATASRRMPVVHTSMEPPDLSRATHTNLTVTTYADGVGETRTLGRVHAHGLPVRLGT
jgi:hypothetical protein